MRRYPHAVLGGTFDRLHVGHAALLASALAAGRRVSVGVTTDAFVRASAKPLARRIQPYATRRRALVRWFRRHARGRAVRLVPLGDRFGRSVGPGVDVLVVSAETADGGRSVNGERRRRGLPALPIRVVPLALADDLEPVSSRRIRAGTIDRFGRRRSPIRVGVDAADPTTFAEARRGVRRAFPRARIVRGPFPVGGRSTGRRATPPAPPVDLAVRVARRRAGGWSVSIASRAVALAPRIVPAGPGSALADAIARGLAPRRPQAL